MIFRFPVVRTDKVGLTHAMRVARLYMKAYCPDEVVTGINYNSITISIDVHTIRGTETDIVYVCAHPRKEQ